MTKPGFIETTVAVEVQARVGHDALPHATLVSALIPRTIGPELLEAPMFHFRKWIDYGHWNEVLHEELREQPLASFVIETSGFHAHAIDRRLA